MCTFFKKLCRTVIIMSMILFFVLALFLVLDSLNNQQEPPTPIESRPVREQHIASEIPTNSETPFDRNQSSPGRTCLHRNTCYLGCGITKYLARKPVDFISKAAQIITIISCHASPFGDKASEHSVVTFICALFV